MDNNIEQTQDIKQSQNFTEHQPKPKPITTIIIIILALLLAASATINIIQFLTPQKPNTGTAQSDDTPAPAPTTDTAGEYIEEMKEYIMELNGNYVVDLNYGSSSSVIVRTDAYNFFSSASGYSISSFTPNEYQTELDKLQKSPEFYKKIATKITNDGFTKTNFVFEQMGVDVQIYENDKIICNVPTLSDYNTASDGQFLNTPSTIFGCADKTIAIEQLKDISSFAEAYKTKTGEWPDALFGDTSNISNSTQAPYQTIVLNFMDSAGLFYRTSPDTTWVYFTRTQQVLNCDAYNTDDLKKAYLGETCYLNDGNPSKVSL